MRKGCLGVGFVYPDHDVVRVRLEVRRSNMRNRGGGGGGGGGRRRRRERMITCDIVLMGIAVVGVEDWFGGFPLLWLLVAGNF